MKDWNGPMMLEEMKRPEGAQGNKMGQGSPKQREYKPNNSTGLLELSRRKLYNRPKRGPTNTSQMITWQKQRGNMAKVLANPQRR